MLLLLLNWVLMAGALLLVDNLLPGMRLDGYMTAIVATLVLSLVNHLVKPVLGLLTIPITLLTFGLFLLVINAWMLWLTSGLVPGFEIDNFWTAFWGSILLSIVSSVVLSFVPKDRAKQI
jgi:putative membrane protein